jgi:hypothetical protein
MKRVSMIGRLSSFCAHDDSGVMGQSPALAKPSRVAVFAAKQLTQPTQET